MANAITIFRMAAGIVLLLCPVFSPIFYALYLIDGYPDGDTAFIGFFMMNRQLQGRRIGSSIIQDLCLYLKETGLKRVLLGIDKENPQSNAFWAKNGFSVIREVEQEEGTILLAEKCL